jgi:hypothetical protein
MSSERYSSTLSGGALGLASLGKMATAASHADDYVFQELLKLAPCDGTNIAKVILPYQANGQGSPVTVPLLSPTGTPPYSLNVAPFRAVLGTRVTAQQSLPTTLDPATSPDLILPTMPELAYRDIRSAVLTGATSDAPASAFGLGFRIPDTEFVANTSAFPRWDLVYATLYIEQPSSPAYILVKPPITGAPAPQATSLTFLCTVGSPAGAANAISVKTGLMTNATPPVPTLPADTPLSGIFNFPLGYVQIPAGFTVGTAITPQQICTSAPVGTVAPAMGAPRMLPMGQCAGAAAIALVGATWGQAAGPRPPMALPTTMVGLEIRHMMLDASLAIGSAPFADMAIVDETIDWRNRYFWALIFAYGSTNLIASDPTATTACVPQASLSAIGSSVALQAGQSYRDDSNHNTGLTSRSAGFVCYANNSILSQISAGASSAIGLYVTLADGNLRLLYRGTPSVRAMIWILATAPFENF